jgi:hypothetical protein
MKSAVSEIKKGRILISDGHAAQSFINGGLSQGNALKNGISPTMMMCLQLQRVI